MHVLIIGLSLCLLQITSIWGQYTFKVTPIAGNINTHKQEFGPSISSDGKTLYFYSKRGSKYTDIYFSQKKNNQWSSPQKVHSLNSPYDDQSPFLARNGKFIIFSSNRDGATSFRLANGKVGVSRDLFYAQKTTTGRWSRPVALPPQINTIFIEENPFLLADRFYFIRYPFNRSDLAQVYAARIKNNQFVNEPATPLPAPINQKGYATLGVVISADGKEMYFSSNRPGGYGGFDIYKAKIDNGKFGKPENLGPEINTKRDEAYHIIDPNDNSLIFCRNLPGKSFDILVGKEVPKQEFGEILKIKKKITLNNIHFDINSSNLKKQSLPELDKIAKFLLEDSDVRVRITGHTDLTGDLNFNQGLSERRAQAVKEYFISKGIAAKRIQTTGKGSTQPIFHSKKKEHNRINRRTEFEILD